MVLIVVTFTRPAHSGAAGGVLDVQLTPCFPCGQQYKAYRTAGLQQLQEKHQGTLEYTHKTTHLLDGPRLGEVEPEFKILRTYRVGILIVGQFEARLH